MSTAVVMSVVAIASVVAVGAAGAVALHNGRQREAELEDSIADLRATDGALRASEASTKKRVCALAGRLRTHEVNTQLAVDTKNNRADYAADRRTDAKRFRTQAVAVGDAAVLQTTRPARAPASAPKSGAALHVAGADGTDYAVDVAARGLWVRDGVSVARGPGACLDLGAGDGSRVAGSDAGKVCYAKLSDGLDVVGRGPNGARQVRVWDRLSASGEVTAPDVRATREARFAGGKSALNPGGRLPTLLPSASDGRNYVRGDTEVQGDVVGLGGVHAERALSAGAEVRAPRVRVGPAQTLEGGGDPDWLMLTRPGSGAGAAPVGGSLATGRILAANEAIAGTVYATEVQAGHVWGGREVQAGADQATSVQLAPKEIKLRGDGYAHYSIFNDAGALSINNTSVNAALGTKGTPLLTFDGAGNAVVMGALDAPAVTTARGVTVKNNDPGPMLEKMYGTNPGNRYGVGQWPGGTMRVYAAGLPNVPATLRMGFAAADGGFNDVTVMRNDNSVEFVAPGGAPQHRFTAAGDVTHGGTVRANAGVCVQDVCLSRADLQGLKQQLAAGGAGAGPGPTGPPR